jgi:hypothetical protein
MRRRDGNRSDAHLAGHQAFVCECHNLPPFSTAIQAATGKPVFDILSLVAFALQGFSKPRFG